MSFFDNRAHERRFLRTAATVSLATGQQFEIRTLDISRGGMGVVVSANPPPGTEFDIRVVLPLRTAKSAVLEARVRVAHSIYAGPEGGFKVGLQFVDLSPSGESAIKLFFT